MHSQFICYFGPDSVFSHWYKCDFTVNGQAWNCVEQYIMYQKALLFSDPVIAEKIRRSSDPQRHRYLGREVAGFDRMSWQRHCRQYAFEADLAKFSQNAPLRDMLLATNGKDFVEASPYDRTWGVGLSLGNSKIYDRRNWRGKNWAGEVLNAVRTSLDTGKEFFSNRCPF